MNILPNLGQKNERVEDVLAEVAKAAARNRDEQYSLRDLHFVTPSVVRIKDSMFKVSDTAKSQLGQTFGVKWNKWFQDGIGTDVVNSELRLRARGLDDAGERKLRLRMFPEPDKSGVSGIVRGILSSSYTPIDDVQILKIITGVLENDLLDSDTRIISTPWEDAESDKSTSISFLLKEPIIIKNGKEDVFYPAIHFSNSEVGKKAVTVDDAIVRLICINGMLQVAQQASLVRQIHTSIDEAEFAQNLESGLRMFKSNIPKIAMQIKDSHEAKMNAESFDEQIERFTRRNHLPMWFSEQAQQIGNSAGDFSRFGLSQAVTEAAHQLSTEDAYTAERAAAALI